MRRPTSLLGTALPGALIGFALLYGPSLALAQTAPPLGAAEGFAVLGSATVTNTGPTTVTGDLGVSPGTAITGFPPGTVAGGSTHAADALAAQAQIDAGAAYANLAAQACTTTYAPVTDLGGMTLLPGVHCFPSSAAVTGTLTLNAQGNPNAVFVFKTGSTFITASAASVSLINGGQNCNVFWQVGSSATLGTTSTVPGTIIALASITMNTGSSSGRSIARTGAVTLDSNNVVGCATAPPAEPTAPPLGAAGSFVVLGSSTVTSTGPTIITGDLGVSPGTAVTGFPPGTLVGGSIHAADAPAAQAQIDAGAAYTNLTAQACTTTYPAVTDLGGMTLLPGVYCFASSAAVTGTLTLNAQGNPDAVFIFKTGSTFITASAASVLVINGGRSCNVFWRVGSSATLGTTSTVQGTMIAQASITLNTGATVTGRSIARTGAVTLDSNTIGGCSAAETVITGGGGGLFPPNASFNGIPITGLEFGFGLEFSGDGDKVGEFNVVLLGTGVFGPQSITLEGSVTGGVTVSGNVARFSGTATLDMGAGAPALPGVPFAVTLTTDANDQGSLGLVIGTTTLPSAAVNEGTMTITAPPAP